MKSARNYKALYQQCAKESARKDRLIAVQQSQVAQLAGECHTLRIKNADQAATIKQYEERKHKSKDTFSYSSMVLALA